MKTCAHCGVRIGGRHYREVSHCWVERRAQGGANAARLAIYTGRLICPLCLDKYEPDSDPVPKVRACDRCGTDHETLFLEVTRCLVLVRAKGAAAHAGANAITAARYSGLAVCRPCLFEAEQGEQLGLFS